MSSSSGDSVLGSIRDAATMLWMPNTQHLTGGATFTYPAPPFNHAWIVLSVDLFYYGGSSGDQIHFNDTFSGLYLRFWAPTTTNNQSLPTFYPFWVSTPSNQLRVHSDSGTFDVRVTFLIAVLNFPSGP